jgi:NaMN:DMB phosphoribosyltransferase
MVNLWWIAGESWQVDGHFSGFENFPLSPDLFLRNSHFGNNTALTSVPNQVMKEDSRIEPYWS